MVPHLRRKKKVPKPKRCSEENARRMAKARHFSREHGQAVRQNSVRTASSEAAGSMPYEIGWQLQRDTNKPPNAPSLSEPSPAAEAEAVPVLVATASPTQPSKEIMFHKDDVFLLWLGDQHIPPILAATLRCDIFSTIKKSRVQKRVSKKLLPSTIMFSWLTEDINEDGISLTLEDDDENYSATEVSSLLEDGSLVLLGGVRRISSNGWIISEEDMDRSRRKMLGCIESEEEEEEEEGVREDDEEDGEEEGNEGSQEEGACAKGDPGAMGA